MVRSELISEIANRIICLKTLHPIRVGVSGITVSGKTTFANELTEELRSRKMDVIRASIENFHNQIVIRYRQGKESAIGYYEDAHDYNTFRPRGKPSLSNKFFKFSKGRVRELIIKNSKYGYDFYY